jgi:hypothetical protein
MKRFNPDSPSNVYKAEIHDDRVAWRDRQLPRCMWCLCSESTAIYERFGLHQHEIERRAHASKTCLVDCNYLMLCGTCHNGPFANLKTWPHAKQLALKMLRNPDDYDLAAWLLIKFPDGKAPNRVTQSEVDAFYKELTR